MHNGGKGKKKKVELDGVDRKFAANRIGNGMLSVAELH